MNSSHNIFRIVLFFVAVIHCFSLIQDSFKEFKDLETYKIEISDLDSNESDSEEREEEEQKLINFVCDYENQLKSLLFQRIISIKNSLVYQFNTQSEVLSVLESPPEQELS